MGIPAAWCFELLLVVVMFYLVYRAIKVISSGLAFVALDVVYFDQRLEFSKSKKSKKFAAKFSKKA